MSVPQECPTLVEFDFSLQQETYRFRRSQYTHLKRGTKEPELRETHECFRLEKGEFRLLESGSESAVRRRAEQLLHLTCEQFSQVIVLPQGEFLRLLRANSKDKGEMLKTLFSAGIWKELTDAFHQRARTAEETIRRKDALKTSLLQKEQADSLAALEERAKELARREGELRQTSRKLSQELEQSEALLQAAENYARLTQAWEEAQKALEEAKAAWSQAEKALPLAQEKRRQAQTLREQAVTLAQEETQLTQRLEAWNRAESAGKQAAAARKQLGDTSQKLEELRQQGEILSQRLERGNAFVESCQAAAEKSSGPAGTTASLGKAEGSLGGMAAAGTAKAGSGTGLTRKQERRPGEETSVGNFIPAGGTPGNPPPAERRPRAGPYFAGRGALSRVRFPGAPRPLLE